MLRMTDLTEDTRSAVDIVAYRSGELVVIAINIEGITVARVSVPADGNAADVVGQVAAEVALSWPAGNAKR